MINTNNLEEAKKEIKKATKPVIVLSQNLDFDRKILEYGKFQVLMSPELHNSQLSIKNSNSGLNEIYARIAKKNKIAIGINLEQIKNLKDHEKIVRLTKIRQNIEICRSIGTRIYIKGEYSKDLLLSLGASTKQAHEATQSF